MQIYADITVPQHGFGIFITSIVLIQSVIAEQANDEPGLLLVPPGPAKNAQDIPYTLLRDCNIKCIIL
jgi:hypothetical protein